MIDYGGPFDTQFRYTAGQKFGQHYDDSVLLGDGQETVYTVLIYLSGMDSHALVGGETVFYGASILPHILPKKFRCCFFMSTPHKLETRCTQDVLAPDKVTAT